MSEEKLLPCPFCGDEPELHWINEEGEVLTAWVRCKCGCEHHERLTKEVAVKKWNSRHLPNDAQSAQEPMPSTDPNYKWGVDYGKDLLRDINQLAHAAGTGALHRDMLQRAYREIKRLSTASSTPAPDTLAVAQAMYDWQYGSGAWFGNQSSMKDHYVGLARAAVASMVSSATRGSEAK